MVALIIQLIQQLSSIITNTHSEVWAVSATLVILVLALYRYRAAGNSAQENEKGLAYNH
ncbi:MAG: hypothetical protein WBG71_15875 [Leeuwenhoekiella sp.]